MKIDFQDHTRFTKLLSQKGDINRILAKEVGGEFEQYRQLWSKVSNLDLVTDFPLHLGFELNHSCNLRCPMCTWSADYADQKGKVSWVDFETFKKVIDEGVAKGLRSIALNWVNEPLIRPDLPRFAAYAKEKGILDIIIHSNGMLLKEKVSEELIDAGLTRLMISLDALTENTYDQIRIGGSLPEVRDNIFKFLEIRKRKGKKLPLISVNFVKMAMNEEELEDFINFWFDHVDFFAVQELINPFYGIEENPFEGEEEKKNLKSSKVHEVMDFKCAQPYQRMNITYEGDVLPCCTFYAGKLVMGNIHESSVEEIWNSEQMKNLRKMHFDGKYFENPVCRACAKSSIAKDLITGEQLV